MTLKRINLNLSEELINQVEESGKKLNINCTAMISVILSQYYQQSDALEQLRKLTSIIDEEKAKRLVE